MDKLLNYMNNDGMFSQLPFFNQLNKEIHIQENMIK